MREACPKVVRRSWILWGGDEGNLTVLPRVSYRIPAIRSAPTMRQVRGPPENRRHGLSDIRIQKSDYPQCSVGSDHHPQTSGCDRGLQVPFRGKFDLNSPPRSPQQGPSSALQSTPPLGWKVPCSKEQPMCQLSLLLSIRRSKYTW